MIAEFRLAASVPGPIEAIVSVITPVLFLQRQVKMSAVKIPTVFLLIHEVLCRHVSSTCAVIFLKHGFSSFIFQKHMSTVI